MIGPEILPRRGRGTMRSMVDGSLGWALRWGRSLSTTPLRIAVPFRGSGSI